MKKIILFSMSFLLFQLQSISQVDIYFNIRANFPKEKMYENTKIDIFPGFEIDFKKKIKESHLVFLGGICFNILNNRSYDSYDVKTSGSITYNGNTTTASTFITAQYPIRISSHSYITNLHSGLSLDLFKKNRRINPYILLKMGINYYSAKANYEYTDNSNNGGNKDKEYFKFNYFGYNTSFGLGTRINIDKINSINLGFDYNLAPKTTYVWNIDLDYGYYQLATDNLTQLQFIIGYIHTME